MTAPASAARTEAFEGEEQRQREKLIQESAFGRVEGKTPYSCGDFPHNNAGSMGFRVLPGNGIDCPFGRFRPRRGREHPVVLQLDETDQIVHAVVDPWELSDGGPLPEYSSRQDIPEPAVIRQVDVRRFGPASKTMPPGWAASI